MSPLVVNFRVVQVTKKSYVQCLHFGEDLNMFLKMFLMSNITLF
jgi:hypothetical protein